MAKRIKKMPIEQFAEVMKRNWKPVELVGSASPDWLKNIPKDVLNSGPILDDEHWLDQIPEKLRNAEVLGVPKKPR